MSTEIQLLAITAASVGFFHTLAGPDHYLPFIVMAKARKWPAAKTVWITLACGLGHVLSSVVLGSIGVAFGLALVKLELIESFRGDIAAWFLTAFGFTYLIWGLHRAIKNRFHTHIHMHENSDFHTHEHNHRDEHVHVHEGKALRQCSGQVNITPWILFTIFIFGPCEPLIPILMYPAARESVLGILIVGSVFALATIGTMLVIVTASLQGIAMLPAKMLGRYTHAFAGGTIFLCGLAIIFLGL